MKIVATRITTSTNTTGTVYTVPSGQYAIINWVIGGTGTGTLALDGVVFCPATSGSGSLYGALGGAASPIHAGPGTVISTVITGSCTVALVGVLFSN